MSNVLTELSDQMADSVAAAGAGVVRVEARRRIPATGIVWGGDGVIVTSNHGVERDDGITVGLDGGEVGPAELVGRDPMTDVAVLRRRGAGMSPIEWAGPEEIRVGQMALALGRPGGSLSATLGVVSVEGREWRTPGGGRLESYVRTDAAMLPGFSGGPLMSAGGKVIGLNTTGLVHGASVTILLTDIQRVVEALLEHGRVPRGRLGVAVQAVRLPEGLSEKAGQETGLLAMSVEAGSPAAEGGLLLGDTLVSLEGQSLRFPDELLATLGGDRIGQEVTIRLVRGGALQEVRVRIGDSGA